MKMIPQRRVIPDDYVIEVTAGLKEGNPLIQFEVRYGEIDLLINQLRKIKDGLTRTDIFRYEDD